MSRQSKQQLRAIFNSAVNSVKPHKLIENKIKLQENNLIIEDKNIPLGDKVYLVGFGKAVMGMAMSLEKLLAERLTSGIISIPRGSMANLFVPVEPVNVAPLLTGVIKYYENSINNQPDDDTLRTTHDIMNLVEGLTSSDTLIVLISGGGSALLSMPQPIIPPDMKTDLCKKLFNSGADIKEVNIIRQKLSMVKAGGLARLAYPANVIGLILSDIIGDPIELIASGPTVYTSKAPEECTRILKKYNLYDNIDVKLKKILMKSENNDAKSLLNEQKQFKHVDNFIIGNNLLAIEAARLECLCQNLNAIVLRHDIHGLVKEIGLIYARLCYAICKVWNESLSQREFIKLFETEPELSIFNKRANEIYQVLKLTKGQGLVLIAGGETEVMVTGSGKGGRNQELALLFSLNWFNTINNNPNDNLNNFEVILLSAGTDGQDGPTDAAGAFGYMEINSIYLDYQKEVYAKYKDTTEDIKIAAIKKIDSYSPENIIKTNNSYNFYSKFCKGADLLKTGLTGTNVMDLHLIYIKQRPHCCLNKSNQEDNCEHDFF